MHHFMRVPINRLLGRHKDAHFTDKSNLNNPI